MNMLLMIGPLIMKVAPFNVSEYTRTHGGDFVEKPVMGIRPPVEYVGNGPETWSIKASLHPDRFGGGGNLALLTAMRASGLPQYMLRGDGSLLGWVVIESVTERSSYLNGKGVGKVIDVDISLRRAGAPSAGGFFAALSGLFGVLK